MTTVTNRTALSRLLLIFMAGLASACGQDPEAEEAVSRGSDGEEVLLQDRDLRLALAGRGDPWSHMGPWAKPIFLGLHQGLSVEEIGRALEVDPDSLMVEIEELESVGLLKREGSGFRPDFFLADREEAEAAYAHARSTGDFLAEEILLLWPDLEAVYGSFSIGEDHSLFDLGFFLVGGRILDMGMLAALVDDGSLLESAPARPSPERPDGRYYFWAVEAGPEYLGRYGENSSNFGETKWAFVTFGANYVQGRSNARRNDLEDRFGEHLEAYPGESPAFFGKDLSVPVLSKEESDQWARVSEEISRKLVARLLEEGPDIPAFFRTLGAGAYAGDRRPEFVVWYYHMAYGWAIDHLIEEGAIARPDDEFLALILWLEDEGGVLKGF